ncbi:Ig-like domain-containing protein [Ilumatobacter sp.]|uniref:Ig-like domain-containing protein n=1 Tax=Ilumatobacter sp. TaxID=1967498 RepID=UPI003B51F7AF
MPLQQVPGALNAFSAIRIVEVPGIGDLPAADLNLLPVTATVADAAGNASTAEVSLSVVSDTVPEIQAVTPHREAFMPRDTVGIDVTARDDVAVDAVEVTLEVALPDGSRQLLTRTRTTEDGLITATTVQESVEFDLAGVGEVAFDQDAVLTVLVRDSIGQPSERHVGTVRIGADLDAPSISVSAPTPGTTLYAGEPVRFAWRAQDDSYLASVRFEIGGAVVAESAPATRLAEGDFVHAVPAGDVDSLTLRAIAVDVTGRTTERETSYAVSRDEPPRLSIRTPAPGIRLTEGEAFGANVAVSDNRGLDRVEFFREEAGVRETLRTESLAGADRSEAERYVAASLRAPGKGARLGVLAVDDAGLVAELYFDIELLDDEEAPNVRLELPDGPLELMPGDAFEILGAADDDIHVREIEAILVDADGAEQMLDWRFFAREDEEIRITAPNPDTFGSVLVATRHATDFSGEIELPRAMIERAGERFTLVVRASDHGVNATDTPGVPVTVLADTEGPTITFSAPDETLVADQPVKISASVADNLALASYALTVDGEQTGPLVEDTLDDDDTLQVSLAADWEIGGYEIPATGLRKTLRITATDIAGNTSVGTRTVTIRPDAAPQVRYQDQFPAPEVPAGGTFGYALRVEDDFVSGKTDRVFTVATTLETDPASSPSGYLVGDDIELARPRLAFEAPVFSDAASTVTLGNGVLAEALGNGSLVLGPTGRIDELSVAFGSQDAAQAISRYRVSFWPADPCLVAGVDEVDGPVDLGVSGPYGDMARIVVEPLYEGAASPDDAPAGAPTRIVLERAELFETLAKDERAASGTRARPLVALHYADGEGGEVVFAPGPAEVAGEPSRRDGGVFYRQAHLARAPRLPGVDALALYGFASDKASLERGPVALEPIARVPLSEAYAPVELALVSPESGSPVRPMDTLELELSAATEAGLDTYALLRDGVPEGGRILGIPGEDRYRLHYRVPARHDGGTLELGPLAEDVHGRASTLAWSLPLVANEPPQTAFTELASYRLPGSSTWRYVIDDPQRLDYAEFWLRTGEDFRLGAMLADDVALASYEISRLDGNGGRTTLYEREYGAQCPNAPPATLEESATLTFTESVVTEYELRLDRHLRSRGDPHLPRPPDREPRPAGALHRPRPGPVHRRRHLRDRRRARFHRRSGAGGQPRRAAGHR